MDDHAHIAALTALASGDAEGALEAASRLKLSDQRATDGTPQVIKAPGQLGSTLSDSAAMRAEMEVLGFVWLDEPSSDARELLTQYVRLQMPAGWELRRGSDARQRYLHDERGVRRVSLYDVGQFWDPYCATTLIHIGGDVAMRLVYGDNDLEAVCWDALTADEREQVRTGLRRYLADRERHPDIYADSGAAAERWLATMGEPA